MDPPNHRTYAALSADPAASALGTGDDLLANLQPQFGGWSATAASPEDGPTLLGDVLMDMGTRLSGGIGVFVKTAGSPGGTLQVLHGMCKHAGSSHRGNVCACQGDVLEVDIDIVEFDTALLDITGDQLVAADADYQQELFDADPAIALVPAFAANAARTKTVKTRNAVFIPGPLLQHVLDQELTPRQAFETLWPLIQDAGIETLAEPLLDFPLVATTRVGAGADATTAVRQDTAGAIQGARAIVQDRRENLLHRHLPALRPTNMRSDPALIGIMNCMREQRNANPADLNDRRLEREKASAPQTVDGKWPSCVDRLCKTCGVIDTEDLPAHWHNAAAWKRGSGTTLRSALEEATRVAAKELGANPPQITVQHANSPQNWLFIGPTIHCVGNGIVPLAVTPPHGVSLNAERRIALDHDQAADDTTMVQGNGNITAADARSLRTGACVPVNFDEAEASLEAYGATLGAILGVQHALVKAHVASLKVHGRIRQQCKQITARRFGEPLAAATLAYHCHVSVHCWFEEQWNQDAPGTAAPPPFSEGFKAFARGNDMSWSPDTTLVDAFGAMQPDTGDHSQLGGLTPAPAPAPRQDPTPRPARERARNRNRDSRVIGENALAARIRRVTTRDAIAKGGDPPSSGNTERCLSWHLKGNCFADCPRKADHAILEGEEKESLYEWVKRPATQGCALRTTQPATKVVSPKHSSKVATPELGENIACVRCSHMAVTSPSSKLRANAPAYFPRRPPHVPRVSSVATAPVRRDPPTEPVDNELRAVAALQASESPEELDDLIRQATRNFLAASSWEEFFDLQRDPRGDWGQASDLEHPAGHLLNHYKNEGVPVQMTTPPWPAGRIEAALRRGPHKSAKEHREFLRNECVDMIKKGHWVLLPARLLKNDRRLRLGPPGVAPQRERRPRTISDCSYCGINQDTLKLAPAEAMQFGRALQRILQRIHDANPRCGPVHLARIDMADGFHRTGLRPRDAVQSAILFPNEDGEEPLVGAPLTLPVGWAESPPAFCTATETTADLANWTIAEDPELMQQRPHRLDTLAETPPEESNEIARSRVDRTSNRTNRTEKLAHAQEEASGKAPNSRISGAASAERSTRISESLDTAPSNRLINQPPQAFDHGRRKRLQKPLRCWDVCVDDFLGPSQGNKGTRRRVKRCCR